MQQLRETLAHLFRPRRSNNHRSRLLHNDALVVLCALALGFALFTSLIPMINPKMGYILGYANDISIQDVVAQTNAQRASVGLPPLKLNTALSNAAAGKARDMFANQYWAHTSPSGVEPWAFISDAGYSYLAAGENLARDFMHTSDMVAAWMASPTHKANIVNAKYEEIGVAVVNGTLDGIETTLVVQMFGKPQGLVGQSPAVISEQAAEITNQELDEKENLERLAPQSGNLADSSLNDLSLSESEIPVDGDQEAKRAAVEEDLQLSGLERPVFQVKKALALTEGDFTSSQVAGYISPLHLMKSFAVSILILLMATLIYDMLVDRKQPTNRFVGKNAAHILFFLAITFVVVIFKSGFVG